MTTIDQVRITVRPYMDVFLDAVYAMCKAYDYAPRSYGVEAGDYNIIGACSVVLRYAALLESGQSTDEHLIQYVNKNISDSHSTRELADHITSVMNQPFVIVRGSKYELVFKAQATRNNDGCTIHTTFDVKYGGDGRRMLSSTQFFYALEDDYDAYDIASYTFDKLIEKAGFSGLRGNEAAFLKMIRDDNLLPGVNLDGLSDDEIVEASKGNALSYKMDMLEFIEKSAGMSRIDVTDKMLPVIGLNAEFDVSQLSFHFEYDIELDEDRFRSMFEIEGQEPYVSKAAAQDDEDEDVVKSKVLEKLEEVLSDYDAGDREFDLEELAEQIAECRGRVEVFDEIDDGDDDEFFSMCDEFAKDSTYVVHTYDGGCSYDLIGEQKDEHVYSFEFGKYLNTGLGGYTFVIIDGGEPLDIDGNSFKSSDAFDLLASATHCSVLELPHRLVGNGYKDFDKENLLSANDESEIYEWLDSNIYAGDIINILEEEELIEVIAGEYSKTLNKFEIDFSDCFE